MKPSVYSLAIVAALSVAESSARAGEGFDVVVLGARGGIEDGNLSSFMIAPADDDRAVTCDAGSLVNGLIVAERKGALDGLEVPADSPYTRVGHVLTETSRVTSSAMRTWITSPVWLPRHRMIQGSPSTDCRR
jgi:hypothetical protein